MNIARSILGIIVGLVIGSILITTGIMIATVIYPPSTTLDPRLPEDLRLFYSTRPTGWYAGELISYLVGVFFASFAAAKVAGRAEALHGFIIILLYVVFGIFKLSVYPEPAWVMIGSVIIYFIGGMAGSAFAGSLRGARQAGPVTVSE